MSNNPETTNRSGCFIFLVVAVVIAFIIYWLAMNSSDSKLVNEVVGAAAGGR